MTINKANDTKVLTEHDAWLEESVKRSELARTGKLENPATKEASNVDDYIASVGAKSKEEAQAEERRKRDEARAEERKQLEANRAEERRKRDEARAEERRKRDEARAEEQRKRAEEQKRKELARADELRERAEQRGAAHADLQEKRDHEKQEAKDQQLKKEEQRKAEARRNAVFSTMSAARRNTRETIIEPIFSRAQVATDKVASMSTAGGVGLLLLILIFLLFVVVSVDSTGSTRLKQLWYMLNGRAVLEGSYRAGAGGDFGDNTPSSNVVNAYTSGNATSTPSGTTGVTTGAGAIVAMDSYRSFSTI